MRPVTSAVPSPKAWAWTSPLPYVFGGLGAIFGLIAVALLVIACTRRKSPAEGDGATALPRTAEKPTAMRPLDMEPKVVVVMAGDDVPTFLAMPLPVAATTASFQLQRA